MLDLSVLNQVIEDKNTYLRKMIDRDEYRNLGKTLADMYVDKAHFVYELIQNADDVFATKVDFILTDNGIVFIHNGTKKFTVSKPKDSRKDDEVIGDINAITAFAASSKPEDALNKIGKFGLGFKSVYMYSDNPIIREDNFCIKIVDQLFIEHSSLPNDIVMILPNDYKQHTVFYLPFKTLNDCTDSTEEENSIQNYKAEILAKLQELVLPSIFLNTVTSINIYDVKDWICSYKLDVIKEGLEYVNNKDIKWSFIKYQFLCNNEERKVTVYFWKLSREFDHKTSYSVLYKSNESGTNLIAIKNSLLFCYFSLGMAIKTPYVMHGPFKLIKSRDNIIDNKYNTNLLSLIANLAAESIVVLKNQKAYGDEIVDIVKASYLCLGERITGSIKYPTNIYRDFLNVLSIYDVIPTDDRTYHYAKDCYCSGSHALSKVLNPSLLYELTKEHLVEVFRKHCSMLGLCNDIKIKTFFDYSFPEYVTPNLMNSQSIEWRIIFYNYIFNKENNFFNIYYKSKRIFRTSNEEWRSYHNGDGKVQIFKKDDSLKGLDLENDFYFLASEYETNSKLKEIIDSNLKLVKPNLSDLIEKLWEKHKNEEGGRDVFFDFIIRNYIKATKEIRDKICEEVSEYDFIRGKADNDKICYYKFSELMLVDDENELLINRLKEQSAIHIIEYDYYTNKYLEEFSENDIKTFFTSKNFQSEFSVAGEVNLYYLYIYRYELLGHNIKDFYPDISFGRWPSYENMSYTLLIGFKKCLAKIYDNESSFEKKVHCSKIIFDTLVKLVRSKENSFLLTDMFYTKISYGCYFDQKNLRRDSILSFIPFLIDKDNKFITDSQKLKYSHISDIYGLDNLEENVRNKIVEFLRIKDDTTQIEFTESNVKKLKENGLNEVKLSKMVDKLPSLLNFWCELSEDEDFDDQKLGILKEIYSRIITEGSDLDECLNGVKDRLKKSNVLNLKDSAMDNEQDELDDLEEELEGDEELDDEDSDTNKGSKRSGCVVGGHNPSSLSPEQRKKASETLRHEAIEYLESIGCDLSLMYIRSNAQTILNNVFYEGDCINVNYRSNKKGLSVIRFSASEVQSFIDEPEKYRLLVYKGYGKFSRLYTIYEILRSNEKFTISLSPKDLPNDQLYRIIQNFQYIKTFNLELSVLPNYEGDDLSWFDNSKTIDVNSNDEISDDENSIVQNTSKNTDEDL